MLTATIELPSRYWCGFFFVDVLIEEKGPYTFLLDSGSTTAISSSLAKDRQKTAEIKIQDASGRVQPTEGVYFIDSLKCGGWEIRGFEAIAMDLGAFTESLGTTLDGVLGITAFHGYNLTLDYLQRRVFLSIGGLDPGGAHEDNVNVHDLVDYEEHRRPRIRFRIQGREEIATVDTGSDGFLDLPRSHRVLFSFEEPPARTVSMNFSGLDDQQEIALLPELQIGTTLIERAPVIFSGNPDGILGTDFLSNFSVTMDLQSMKLILRRKGSQTIRMPPYKSFGLHWRKRPDAWTVTHVVPGGPAEKAGLRLGDQIIEIDKYQVAQLMGCSALADYCGKDGIFRLTVQRGTEQLKMDLRCTF